jgi:hypothetical protein
MCSDERTKVIRLSLKLCSQFRAGLCNMPVSIIRVMAKGTAGLNLCCTAVQAYEARFNPFAEFQQSEEVNRVKLLPVHDRAILSGTR